MSELSADELLNRALLTILQAPGSYRYFVEINLPWPEGREPTAHLETCPETTVTATGGETRVVSTVNVSTISMTVQCPHVDAAPATLDAYGVLSPLMDEMHHIGQRAAWSDPDEGEDDE